MDNYHAKTFKVAPSYIRCSTSSYGDTIDSAVASSRISKYVDSTKTIEYSTDPDDSIVEIKIKDPYKCKYVARVRWFNDTITVVPSRDWITSGSPDKYVVVPSTASLNGAVKILDKLADTIELQTQKFLDAEESSKSKEKSRRRKAAWFNDPYLIQLCEDMTYDCYDNNKGDYKYDDEFDMEAFIDDAAEHVIHVIKELDDDGVYRRFYGVVDDPRFQEDVRQLCEKYNEDKLLITRRV